MNFLENSDAECLVSLIAKATDPTSQNTINERRRSLLSQLMELVAGDFWMWSISQLTPDEDSDGSTCLSIYGGQIDDQELVRSAKAFMEPKALTLAKHSQSETSLQELVFPIQELGALKNATNGSSHPNSLIANQLGDSLLYFCKHDEQIVSAVGIHRRCEKNPFSARDHALFHLAVKNVAWLHKNIPEIALDPRVTKLSLRTRQVLDLLLAGDSPKQIAAKLNLSTYTVGDYVKKIYHQLGVSSRSELHAYFHLGRQRSKSC